MITSDAIDSVYRRIYFFVQRARHAVSSDMIRSAGEILQSPWHEIEAYAQSRLRTVHGSVLHSLNELERQPFMEKEWVARQGAGEHGTRPHSRVERRKTSGSTGMPLTLFKDVEMTAWMDAAMWAAYQWHGVTPGMRHARFWGLPRERGPRARRRVMDWFLNRVRLDAFDMAPEQIARFHRRLMSFRPRYIHAYPTLLRAFVEQCLEAGLSGADLGVRVAICGGEILTPQTRAVIAEFFQCSVVNEYGCTESGLLTVECEHGTPHVLPVAVWVEVIGPDGMDVATGQVGEVLVTDLYGSVVPLLRYRLQDRAQIAFQHECPCGRSLPRLDVAFGRIDSFIETPDRGPIYDAILAYTVPREIKQFRAVQVAPDMLQVDIVPGNGFDDTTPEACRRCWSEELGPSMRIELRVVGEIPRDPSGKLQYFVPMSDATESRHR